jgi:enediyne polyketide synthase
VADPAPAERVPPSLAVVGLACRFPDADDAPELLDVVLAGRRAFRRIPPVRLDLAEYYRPDPATADATYSTRAALIEGWRFDCAAFGIEPAAFAAADPALWLALETTARALAGAGLTGGTGLNRDRTAVIIGNTLGGDTSRANALRVRWPYVRRVLSDALAREVPEARARAVLRRAERQYLAPFPTIGSDLIAGGSAGTIAAAICSYFGFRGGSQAIDSACSSSTQAVASACTALTAGEIDAAVTGGVDISLDPLELISLAKQGVLAADDVRIYDEQPAGYLPAEGCGVLLLMRTADARAAGLPVYAEIVGWGASAVGHGERGSGDASSQLLAMQRAYKRAGVSPAEIQFFEGNGAGTSEDDDAELAALGVLRSGAQHPAVLGSVKANIGHAKAAAGAAGLIKTVLALSNGVLPPATGVRRPHPMITEGDAKLTLPQQPGDWPDGVRLAAVSTLNSVGANVHLVLRAEPAGRPRADRSLLFRLPSARSLDAHDPVVPRLHADGGEPVPFLLHAPDRFALAAVLSRLASVARWLSDAELLDLACSLARDPGRQGPSRVAIVAAGQEELGARAAAAAALLPGLPDGLLSVQPGIFASQDADGRVALLLSGADGAQAEPDELEHAVSGCLDTLRWLEALEVHATAAVGHGMGALAGLAWAGVLGQNDVIEIADLRASFLHRAAAATDAPCADPAAKPGRPELASVRHVDTAGLRAAIGQKYRFGPPRRRLISTLTGAEVASVEGAVDLICTGFAGADQLPAAIKAGAVGATLLLETGPGDTLAAAAAMTPVPAVSLKSGFIDPADSAQAAAALFAAGALGQPLPLFAGLTARSIDIWRERTFIVSPCEARPDVTAAESADAAGRAPRAPIAVPEPPPSGTPARAGDADEAGAAEVVAPAEVQDEPAAVVTAEPPTVPAGQPAAGGPAESRTGQASAAGGTAADHDPGLAAPAGPDPVPDGRQTDQADTNARSGESVPRATAVPASLADVRAEFERQQPSPVADQLAGVGPWARCYAEVMRPAEHPAAAAAGLTWRLHVSGSRSQLAAARGIFAADRAAPRTLAVIGNPADDDARAVAVQAAREAIDTGQLVVVTTSADFTGFFAGLHAEHPEIGVTVLRVPDEDGLRLAPEYARADPGRFRQLALTPDGYASEPRMSELPLAGGAPFPLGPEDVVLVSRGARGAGLVLAQVLACCGTAVAVIGRPDDDDDSALVAGLEELRSAGARIGYEVIDLASPTSLAAAVQRIEGRLGPVTAIGHGVSPCDPVPLQDLTDIEISDHAANEAAGLDRLVGSVGPGRLRMIVTFGSVAATYGLAGGGMTALSSGALAARAAHHAAERNCRGLHIDIPGWARAGLGDRRALAASMAAAGTAPIDVGVASRLLLKVMTTADLPHRIALHGRVSGPAARPADAADVAAASLTPASLTPASLTPATLTAAGLPDGGRFLQNVLVHYPHIELICAPRLSLQADPYLADYQVDGLPMLPPTLALEALAQAASVLAGRPVRAATDVQFASPVVVPAGSDAELRICALRDGNAITAILRCADSSFTVEHARAEFCCAESAEPAEPVTAPARAQAVLSQLTASPSGLVDGGELYGAISCQTGRFQRIALLPEVTTRSCRALARGVDDQPWFEPGSPSAASQFLVGSPGLADACLQVLQACVPHVRLRAAGCASVQFSGRDAEGSVEISARLVPLPRPTPAVRGPRADAAVPGPDMTPEEQADQEIADSRPLSRRARRGLRQQSRNKRPPAADPAPAIPPQAILAQAIPAQAIPAQAIPAQAIPAQAIPAQAGAPARERAAGPHAASARTQYAQLADQRWDIEAVDTAGHLLFSWRGVRVRDAGPLPRTTPWPPSLLAVYLERSAFDMGFDDSLRVAVRCGQPAASGSALLAGAVPAQAAAGPVAGGGSSAAQGATRDRNSRCAAAAAGTGPLAGFSLAVTAAVPVACAWSAAEAGHRHDQPPGAIASVYAQLRDQLAEQPATLAARLRVIGSCLTTAGQPALDAGEGCRATICGDGWVLLHTAAARVACTVVEVGGVTGPVAVAILAGEVAAPEGAVPDRAVLAGTGPAVP